MQHPTINITLFLFLLIFPISKIVQAQTPQFFPFPIDNIAQPSAVACPDQFAGTITFQNFMGQSNDIDLDTIYLCLNDQIDITGNEDADLSGDPNPATPPGITYGFYECPPTVSGPDLATILTDNCIINDPMPFQGIFVSTGGTVNGNLTLVNDGIIQSFFGGGDPVLIWQAPLTIDDFGDKQWEMDGATTGPCVHANTEAAFAVVYLNEMEVSNINTNMGMDDCQGSFVVEGGLSEFDTTNYQIAIQNAADPSILGTIENPDALTHGKTVLFNVPEAGLYTINVEDQVSCGLDFSVEMSSCNVNSVFERSPSVQLAIFPNPTTGDFSFNTNEEMDLLTVRCTNIWGQLVDIELQKQGHMIQGRFRQKNPGVYFLSIVGRTGKYLGRIVVK